MIHHLFDIPPVAAQGLGYIASLLVFLTFSLTEMRWLRIVAIASNVAFIFYAGSGGMMPIFILHSTLLPMNLYRLIQIHRAQAVGRALLCRSTPPSGLAVPQFLSRAAIADGATALELVEREQSRVACMVSLCLPGELTAVSGIDPAVAGAAAIHLLGEIDGFLDALSPYGLTREQVAHEARLHTRNEVLRGLHQTVGELVPLIKKAHEDGPAATAATISEGLGALMLFFEDAIRSRATADFDTVLSMTGDRGALVEQMRADLVSAEAGTAHGHYRAVYDITAAYEKIVWLLRRYVLLVRSAVGTRLPKVRNSPAPRLRRRSAAPRLNSTAPPRGEKPRRRPSNATPPS